MHPLEFALVVQTLEATKLLDFQSFRNIICMFEEHRPVYVLYLDGSPYEDLQISRKLNYFYNLTLHMKSTHVFQV